MEDLLASIRRAIGEEGVDLPELPGPAHGPRSSPNPMRSVAGAARPFGDPPRPSTVRTSVRELPRAPGGDRQPTPSLDIQALRGKIGKELVAEPAPPSLAPPRETAALPEPQFRGILSGREERSRHRGEVLPAPVNAPPTSRALPSRIPIEEAPQELRAEERRAAPPSRATEMAPHVSAFDTPAPGVAGSRPPFGNGSFGIRGFAPPKRTEPGMMSAESNSIAAGAFGKLADTLFQRGGERSIDELTRELLRPMLKQWLDQNLPRLVEALVREEIERVARRGGR